jgi:hypothetical protein
MQHYRLNAPPKALPERVGAELSRFVQHTDALVVTMIEVSPPHRPRTTRATVLSVPFPATQLFEEHVLPKLLLGDTDALLSDRAYALVKTLPPRPEWKRRWILTAGPEAQIPSDVLTGAVSAGVAFHYSRRGVVGVFTAVQDEPERLAAFTKAGWSVSAAPPAFLVQVSMAMQRRPIAFQPFLWGGPLEALEQDVNLLDDQGGPAPTALPAPVQAPAAELRSRPQALASADAPRGFPLGVSATGQSLQLVWNAVSIGIDASGDRLAHALQSFAVRALEQEINVIALLPRDLNVQYALLPLEDAERVLVFDGQNRWKSASLPWKTLSVEHLNALLRRFGARANVAEPYPATFAEALMAAGVPSAATEALRILTAPEGDDLNEIISLGNGALLLLDEPTDMLAADLLLALIAATEIRRPMLVIRPEGITLPRPIAEVAIQLVVDPNTMRLMLRDGGDHWMFEEYGAKPVMMLADLMAEGQAVEGVEEDLVEGLGRDLVPSASPRSDAAGAVPLWLEGEEELRSPELGEVTSPELGEVNAEVEAMSQPAGADDQVVEMPVVLSVLEAAPPIVEVEAASWEDAPVGDDTLPIDWGTPPALDTLAELEEGPEVALAEEPEKAPEGMAAVEPEELQSPPELSSGVEMTVSEELLLARQDGLEADDVEDDTQPLEQEHEQAVATDSELLALAALDEAAELAPVAGDSREAHDDLAAAADDELAPVAFGEGEGDELEAVQFGDDDGLLDLGALGISLPSQPEQETELDASALSLPAEDGRFGQISGGMEAVEAVAVIASFPDQDANEAETEALREQQADEARAEAGASARRRATPGHRGRRRMPAVAFFAAGPGAGELEVPAEHAIMAAEDVLTSAPPVVVLASAEVTSFDADIEAILAMGELAAEPLAEPEAAVEPLAEPEALPEPEAAVEPLAELDVVVVEAPVEPEAIVEALAELVPLAEPEVAAEQAVELEQAQPASLAAADSAFAQGDLDAAEAGYRAVIESDQVENHRAARLGIGRIIAARRNPAPKPVADTPAASPVPVSVDMPAEPAPVAVTPGASPEDDRWSDAALFGAWSRGESIISLSRAYAAANPALTLAGAMARVREVVTTYSAAKTGKDFPAKVLATADTAGVVSETRPVDLAGTRSNGFTKQFASSSETRLADTVGVVSETPNDIPVLAESLDTGTRPMTNGSLLDALGDYAPMTNGSSAALDERTQSLLPDELFSDDEVSNSALVELSPSQLSALVEAIKEDEQTHRATRFGRAIRANWRKGLTFREQTRALKHLITDLDEEGLKRMVDAAVLPDIFLEQGEQLPCVIEAILGTTSDAAGKEHLEQVLMTLTLTNNPLRGSARQRTLHRVRRYLEHRLNTLSNTTEVLYAA